MLYILYEKCHLGQSENGPEWAVHRLYNNPLLVAKLGYCSLDKVELELLLIGNKV